MAARKKRILVLGSSGMIGSHLCKEIEANSYCKALEMDIKRSVYEDLADAKNFTTLIETIYESDFVYFLAFDVGGAKFLYNKQHQFDFINNNMKIMSNVFDALKKSTKPFLFVSSMMATMNWSTYGRLKLLGEECTKAIGNGVSVRFWNVYGKEPLGEKSHVIPDFIRQAKEDEQIETMTTGEEVRQFVHVNDACKALEAIRKAHEAGDTTALKAFADGEIIDITNGDWVSIRYVAETVASIFGNIPVAFNTKKKDLVQADIKVEPNLSVISMPPYSWSPGIRLKDGIQMLIEEYKSNGV